MYRDISACAACSRDILGVFPFPWIDIKEIIVSSLTKSLQYHNGFGGTRVKVLWHYTSEKTTARNLKKSSWPHHDVDNSFRTERGFKIATVDTPVCSRLNWWLCTFVRPQTCQWDSATFKTCLVELDFDGFFLSNSDTYPTLTAQPEDWRAFSRKEWKPRCGGQHSALWNE